MRILVILAMSITLSGCTALMVGGGTSGNSPYQRDTQSGSQSATDANVAASVKNKLASDARISDFDLGVSMNNGKVTLTGTVGSYAARERAEKLAIGTAGVSAVENLIKVQNLN
ncbi:MAG: BON domain-containing protein [Gammaproteobacteria bacterium]|nr:BON domain-containing protein [Gammaproteobacteria bacterium]